MNVVETYVEFNEEEKERFEKAIRLEQNVEILEAQMTWAQKQEAKIAIGVKEGEKRGEERGEKRGEIIGTRKAIELLWQHRLGTISEQARTDLYAIEDLSRLYEILEQISEARSADEVSL